MRSCQVIVQSAIRVEKKAGRLYLALHLLNNLMVDLLMFYIINGFIPFLFVHNVSGSPW